jgi:hypothetical protein
MINLSKERTNLVPKRSIRLTAAIGGGQETQSGFPRGLSY